MSSELGYLPPVAESPVVDLTLAQKAKALYDLGHFPKDASVKAMMDILRSLDISDIEDAPDLASPIKDAYQKAVASWQDFHGRPVTGTLSAFDQNYMVQPRCGIADIMEVSGDGVRQWGIKEITVSQYMSAAGMTNLNAQQIIDAYQGAVDSWNAVCGLKMRVVEWTGTGKTNIWARAAVIDGRGSTLAWSYLPNDDSGASTRLEQRFDPGENWNKQYFQGVAAHELGHAIGLDHINNQSALLYPYARQGVFLPQKLDIAQVVKRYGNPSPQSTTTTTPTPGDGQPPTGKIIVRSAVLTLSDGSQQTLVPDGGSSPAGNYNPL